MGSRSKILNGGYLLAEALPGAQFAEQHERRYRAPVEQVWEAFHHLQWSELRMTKVLLAARGLGGGPGLDVPLVAPPSPIAPLVEERPHFVVSAQISQPWRLRPSPGPEVEGLDVFAAFREPGWVKYGAEWRFTALSAGGTRLRTATICEATDGAARRRFGAYWLAIRAGSGLVRRDLLAGIERRLAR